MKLKNKTLILLLSALLLVSGCANNVPEMPENTEASQQIKEEDKLLQSETEMKEEKEEEIKKEEEKTTPSKNDSDKKEPAAEKPAAEKPVQESAAQNTPAQKPQAPPKEESASKSPEDVINSILSGVDTPDYELTPIDASNFSYYMFIDYIEGAKGVSADALISSTAHSVCLISLPGGTDASQVASEIKNNADPAKWVCVEAESVEVVAKDNMVLLVMSDTNTTNAIVNNFRK